MPSQTEAAIAYKAISSIAEIQPLVRYDVLMQGKSIAGDYTSKEYLRKVNEDLMKDSTKVDNSFRPDYTSIVDMKYIAQNLDLKSLYN